MFHVHTVECASKFLNAIYWNNMLALNNAHIKLWNIFGRYKVEIEDKC
jgi:hypothetical protein